MYYKFILILCSQVPVPSPCAEKYPVASWSALTVEAFFRQVEHNTEQLDWLDTELLGHSDNNKVLFSKY